MDTRTVDRIEKETGGIAIKSDAEGMYYFACDGDNRIGVGAAGSVVLTREQALMLAKELPEIMNTYTGGAA